MIEKRSLKNTIKFILFKEATDGKRMNAIL